MAAVAPPQLARGASAPVLSSPMQPISPNPKARRLSGGAQPGRRLSGWRAEDLENLNFENDDEEERKRAAAAVAEEKKKKKANSPFRATPGHEQRRHIYKEQIEQSMSTAFTMHAKNQVTKKNAFGLDFIDHMRHAINEKDSQDGDTNFALASTTLECASKIYSYKVDAVCDGTHKLLKNIVRGDMDDADSDADDDTSGPAGSEDASEEAQAKAAEKKAKAAEKKAKAAAAAAAAGTAFIETKPESLNMKKLDVALDVDPLFQQTSAKFDAGGVSGLLLNNLHVRDGIRLAFDSTDAGGEQSAEAPPEEEAAAPLVPASLLRDLLPQGSAAAEAHISEEFADFWKTVRPCGLVSEQETLLSEQLSKEGGEEERNDESDEELPPGGDDVQGEIDGGYQSDEQFETDLRGLESDNDIDDDERERRLDRQMGDEEEEEEEVDVLAPEVGLQRGVLSESVQKLIAGDSILRRPSTRWPKARSTADASAGGAEGGGSTRVRKPKVEFVIDFGQRAARMAELEKKRDPKEKKSATLLSGAAKSKAAQVETTLPPDYHCSVDALETLFDRSAHRITYNSKRVRVRTGRMVAGADRASGDAGPSTPSTDAGAGFADDDGWEPPPDNEDEDPLLQDGSGTTSLLDGGDASTAAAPFAGGSGTLVDAPTRVNKINIGYARRATQVDAKALKEALWQLLAAARDEAPVRAAEQPAAAKDKGRGGKEKAPKAVKEVSIQDVVSKLKEKMPADKLAEVSFAYCYICILHLAHEHALDLLGEDNMQDMRVCFPA